MSQLRPTRNYLLAMLAGLPVSLGVIFHADFWMAWVGYVALVFLLGGLDVILALSRKQMKVAVEAPRILHLGEPAKIDLTLEAPGWRAKTPVEANVEVDGAVRPVPITQLRFDGAGSAFCELELEPERRGTFEVGKIHLRWPGPMGLFTQTTSVDVDREVSVVPNIIAVRRAAIRLASHNTFLHGMKQQKFIGDGTEFDALREYIPGLNIRDINWRASARHRKLLCRENRCERNHRVVLAIDTGHLMREPLEGVPKLDHAINVGLLLGYMSLKVGDQVGMFGFDSEPRGYLEPQPGVRTMQRLLEQSARMEYSTHETNFTLALADLANKLRRRAIVVVLTDFNDPIGAELMVENLTWLAKRHLVIFAAIRDPTLDEIANSDPESLEAVNRAVVAGDMRRDREIVITKLRRRGIFCIDGAPSEISVELINRYLEIHRRELV
ncbi:MAG: DUF58 domain-containing protein [Myxococcota bacterium]|nr:DUF58 domain-containing protein [Myxococcota bacterium]